MSRSADAADADRTGLALSLTCGDGNTVNLMLFIDTGSLSLADTSFSIRGI
jgi:hypothetical protein